MGPVMTNIPIQFSADGSTITKSADLLTQYHQVQLEHLQRAAHEIFDTAITHNADIPAPPFTARTLAPAIDLNNSKAFYKRVHSAVVAKLVENCISTSSSKELLLQKEKSLLGMPLLAKSNTTAQPWSSSCTKLLIQTQSSASIIS